MRTEVDRRARLQEPKPRPVVERTEERREESRALTTDTATTAVRARREEGNDPRVIDSTQNGPPLNQRMDDTHGFMDDVRAEYALDPLFVKVINDLGAHPAFSAENGLIYTTNKAGTRVLCIPGVVTKKRRLTERVIDQAHAVLGHLGTQKTSEYIRRYFWW
ncbi:hypothetical protein FA95DRAFT_1504070, partial [Auriscalpium vulgare]